MSQWGKTDHFANSVVWGVTQFNATPNTGVGSNQQKFYGNVTSGGFVTNLIAGQFGVDTTEDSVVSGNLVSITLTTNGSGYTANAIVTITATNGGTSATANAIANTFGKIASVNVVSAGSGFKSNPTITIAAPANTTFNANTAVSAGAGGGANSVITLSSAGVFVAGDYVKYQAGSGNTAITGLANGTIYAVQFANSTVIALADTVGGARITLTKGLTQTGHAIQGATATAVATVGGAQGVAHAGWVVRTVGTGGRAGRVQYETLVAMGSISTDGSDDNILPDS